MPELNTRNCSLYFFNVCEKIHQFRSSIKIDANKRKLVLFLPHGVLGLRQRERPKRTWREVMEKDCQARKLNKEDAIDCSRWRKLIRMSDEQDGCEWVNVSSGTGPPG